MEIEGHKRRKGSSNNNDVERDPDSIKNWCERQVMKVIGYSTLPVGPVRLVLEWP